MFLIESKSLSLYHSLSECCFIPYLSIVSFLVQRHCCNQPLYDILSIYDMSKMMILKVDFEISMTGFRSIS